MNKGIVTCKIRMNFAKTMKKRTCAQAQFQCADKLRIFTIYGLRTFFAQLHFSIKIHPISHLHQFLSIFSYIAVLVVSEHRPELIAVAIAVL